MNAPIRSDDKSAERRDWLDLIGQASDELDRLAVEEIVKRKRLGNPVSALDLECGHGGQAIRMAQAGAGVVAIDHTDFRVDIEDAARTFEVESRVRFMQMAPSCGDTAPLPGAPFDVAVCHHSLAPLRYQDAVRFVRRLLLMMKIGGKLYFSAYGVHSELGDHYPDTEKLVKERYAELGPETADKYGISGPLCLYSERDLFVLLFEAGASVLRTFTTTHGNVKAIAVRV